MGRVFVEEVESNCKTGGRFTLGPRTLILGRNRAGKSAVLNAVELALTGRASDVAGRATLAKDADLFALAPAGAASLWAEVRLSDGSTARFDLEKGKRAKRAGPPGAFPLRDVRDALLGAPETARKWIIGQGGDVEWPEIEALIPTSLRGRLDALNSAIGVSAGTNVWALSLCLETARKRVRETNALAKTKREAARAVPVTPAAPPPRAEINALAAQIAQLDEQAKGYEASLASLPAPVDPELTKRREAALILLQSAVAWKGVDGCPLCSSPFTVEESTARLSALQARFAESVSAEERRKTLAFALREARADVESLRRQKGFMEKAAAAVAAAPANAAAELARRHEEEALQAEREAVPWGQLADALGDALIRLVERGRAAFEAKVQAFLPVSDFFGIELLDGEREVFRFGLREERERIGDSPFSVFSLRTALSGSEWATVTAAIALAVAPSDGLAIVAPEERAFDPETLGQVLEAFGRLSVGTSGCSTQIIVTSPVAPAWIPDGWTVIQLAAERAEPGKPGNPAPGEPSTTLNFQ